MGGSVSQSFAIRAPAKINLTLHVLGRRRDGYHDLESLVAFAGTGDTLSFTPGRKLSLTIEGPNAALVGTGEDNLVLKAARLLNEQVEGLRVGAFRLVKRLPVAAGVGGGSSDAAAALRLLARLNGLPLTDPVIRDAAKQVGSDVTVCLEPRARMMRGAGEIVGPALNLPKLFAILVNPRVPVETPAVFEALGLLPGATLSGPPHPDFEAYAAPEDVLSRFRAGRNDLEEAAKAVQPVIAEALGLVSGTKNCRLARMSGSGATVFGLYDDYTAAIEAAKAVRRVRPEWWIKATSLR